MKKSVFLMAVTAVFCAATFMQGCIFVVGAAAGAAAIAVVYDHRKIENTLTDNKIVTTATNDLNADSRFTGSHIEIACFNQVVLITGETPSADLRKAAEDIVNHVPNVTKVYNQLSVQNPASSLVRTSDGWITTKIKTQLLATKGLQSGTIKVVTEDGIVYLMGIVSHEQADIAADIASQVSGVQRVMKIFQYTD
jgi:osmotically-inducible protein OsmY